MSNNPISNKRADPAAYDAQAQKAWAYLDQHYSYAMHARRLRAAGVR